MIYYNIENILKQNAQYNMIICGQRNGKTNSILKYCIERYYLFNEQAAVIRRWREDFKGKRTLEMFQELIDNDEISKLTNGEYNTIIYKKGGYYLKKHTDHEVITSNVPFMFSIDLETRSHNFVWFKCNICNIFLDEYLTDEENYLSEEVDLFFDVIYRIIGSNINVNIFMYGNVNNKYSPYFIRMGFFTIMNKMNPGDIKVFKHPWEMVKIAVEYSDV